MSDANGAPEPQANRLLGALPPRDLEGLLAQAEIVTLELKETVYEVNQPILHVYFPLSGAFSLLAMTHHHEAIEVGTIGSEGMVGLPVFLGAASAPTMCFSQVPGYSVRMAAPVFTAEVDGRPALHRLMHQYTLALFNQVAQGSACNRHHETVPRLARWLLQTHDRAGADEFPITQEFMSQMLGVRRASATEAAQALQAAGLIRYARGMMTIVDRLGLEGAACSCYRVITDDFERLIPRNPTARDDPAERWGTQ